MPDLDISEVVQRSGLPPSTLRYYEERGLIASVGRRGLHRQFDEQVLERLALISVGQAAGFSLDEIGGMVNADGEPDIDRALLTAKADELDRTIRRLTALRDGLRHAAACPAPNHLACPTFRRILRATSARTASARTASARTASARTASARTASARAAEGRRRGSTPAPPRRRG